MTDSNRIGDLSSRVFLCQQTNHNPNHRDLDDGRMTTTPIPSLGGGSIWPSKPDGDCSIRLEPINPRTSVDKTPAQDLGTSTINALADMLTCKATVMPITVGVFSEETNSDYVSKLANQVRETNGSMPPMPLRFSKLLFLFPLVSSLVFGYVIGLMTDWKIGLSLGEVIMFVQVALLATQTSRFKCVNCLPTILFVPLWIITLIVSTGLFRYHSGSLAKIADNSGTLFAYVISLSIFILLTLSSLPSLVRLIRSLSVSPNNTLHQALSGFLREELETEELVPTTANTVVNTTTTSNDARWDQGSRIGQINEAASLEHSTSLKNLATIAEEERSCRAEIILNDEFAKLCALISAFDRFTGQEQTRFVICLDASETNQREVLTKLVFALHSIVRSRINVPVIFVLEADFCVLMGELFSTVLTQTTTGKCSSSTNPIKSVMQLLTDRHHLVHNSFNLPIYIVGKPVFQPESDRPSMLTPNLTTPNTKCSPNGYSTSQSNNRRRQASMFTGAIRKTISTYTPRMSTNLHNSCIIANKSLPDATDLIHDGEGHLDRDLECYDLSKQFREDCVVGDWNCRALKSLTLAGAMTRRILNAQNMAVSNDQLVLWISFVHYWPYHASWTIIHVEEMLTTHSFASMEEHNAQIDLVTCLREIKKGIGGLLDIFNSLLAEDRDLERLERLLSSRGNDKLSIANFKSLVSCTLTLNPYIRLCIKTIKYSTNNRDTKHLPISENNKQPPLIESRSRLMTTNHPSYAVVDRSTGIGPLPSQSMHSSGFSGQRLTQQIESSPNEVIQSTTNSFTSAETPGTLSWSPINNKMVPLPSQHRSTVDSTTSPTLRLEQCSGKDVCLLMAKIPNVRPDHLRHYQKQIQLHKIDGRQLVSCDLSMIQSKLSMTIGDWQLFRAMIERMRHASARSSTTLIRTSPFDSYDDTDSTTNLDRYVVPATNNNRFQPIQMPQQNDRFVANAFERPHHTVSPKLVRQTPWLISPKLPSTNNSVFTMAPIKIERRDNSTRYDSSDQQNSMSGMEEPESLWQRNTPYLDRKPSSGSKPSNATNSFTKGHEEDKNSNHFMSQSTCDLRKQAKQNGDHDSPRVKRNAFLRRAQRPSLKQPNTAMNIIFNPFSCLASRQSESATPNQLNALNFTTFNPNSREFNWEPSVDLRRMKKRPRHSNQYDDQQNASQFDASIIANRSADSKSLMSSFKKSDRIRADHHPTLHHTCENARRSHSNTSRDRLTCQKPTHSHRRNMRIGPEKSSDYNQTSFTRRHSQDKIKPRDEDRCRPSDRKKPRTHFIAHSDRQNDIDDTELDSGSESEGCTCEYWYQMDHSRALHSLSVPNLHPSAESEQGTSTDEQFDFPFPIRKPVASYSLEETLGGRTLRDIP